ncbi:MAG: glycine cleavage system aminomethyltransferase GcvT [candidate division WOR-3 bacterium]|uniref:Aminomethyltransferase n=1 Tax=candidate division WOR-3 bacterium TaxID=2052148 RepID=A0A7C1RXU4_UNCW3|nr:glycine cleavage system aminomethyltransferase GcvT [candidate division WOR-3 bacterium]
MIKQTPFYPRHLSAGGKIIEFAGYHLPVQFKGIIPEHHHVRTKVGVFDVSHMGRIRISGNDALRFINHMTTNDASTLAVYQAQYSVMCYPDGGIVDDLVVYRLPDHYLLVVNGANNEKDTQWLLEHRNGDVRIENITDAVAQLAIQGPKAEPCLQKICSIDLAPVGFYWATEGKIAGIDCLISRTGYTGEDGFELYIPAQSALAVWDALMEAGREFEIEPIGLGARDTLRLEMKYCLYGNDIDQTTNPLEAGLGFVVKLDKPGGFIGSEVLKQVAQEKPARRLVCLEMLEKAIPRPRLPVFADDNQIGITTSGTMSPSLNKGIALAYVQRRFSSSGTELTIEIRNHRARAVVVPPPFYKSGSRKK